MTSPAHTTRSPFKDQLQNAHYSAIEFPCAQDQIQTAANHFLDFLLLPETLKRQLHFAARSHRASADGYTDKTNIKNKDPKQFFHWSPAIKTQQAYQTLAQNEPTVATFLQSAETLYRQIEQTIVELFNRELPEYKHLIIQQHDAAHNKEDNKEILIDGILRFLSYTPQQTQAFCAQAHFDKGFSTLAIADSAPGLRIGCCNNHPLHPVKHQPQTALFMSAWMLFQASKGAIKPAWHDVIHTPSEQNITPQCARWSIVFFINSPTTPFSSWDELHTPLH